MPFAMTWVNIEIVTLSEVSHTQKDDNIIGYCLHVESKKKNNKKRYKWTYLQNRNRVTDVEKTYGNKGVRTGEGYFGRLGLIYAYYYI